MSEGTPAPDQFSAQFTDNPDLKFSDISGEDSRTYEFPGRVLVPVFNPVAVAVKPSRTKPTVGAPDSHRVVDASGTVHYIPAGWVRLTWTKKPGQKAVWF